MIFIFQLIALAIYIVIIVAGILLYKEVYTFFRNKNKQFKEQQERK